MKFNITERNYRMITMIINNNDNYDNKIPVNNSFDSSSSNKYSNCNINST